MSVKLSQYDEQRLRALAIGMTQNIRAPADILKELGFTEDDWKELEKSRTFKKIMEATQAEWNDAGSTPRRVKLKAGTLIEQSLPDFYNAMVDAGQPLVARVRALEAMTKLAGLPEIEAAERAPGAQFKLEIHLGDNRVEVVNVGAIPNEPVVIEQHESLKLPDYLLDDSLE